MSGAKETKFVSNAGWGSKFNLKNEHIIVAICFLGHVNMSILNWKTSYLPDAVCCLALHSIKTIFHYHPGYRTMRYLKCGLYHNQHVDYISKDLYVL